MKALVTGITGFVGGHLAEHLLACRDEVVGVSASGVWPARTPESLLDNVRVIRCDLTHDDGAGTLTRELGGFQPDFIYHLAAISVPSDCGGDEPTARALAANVGATRRVLEWAHTVGGPRVLFVSSSHVYAPPRSREERCRETDQPRPKNAYGKTKLLAEALVGEAVAAGRGDAVIARAFQHTGPRQGGRMMLPEWAAQFAGGASTIQVRNRDTWIDVSDVRDVVRAYRLLVQQGARGEVYNVGVGVARRTGDILRMLAERAGGEREVVETKPGERLDPIADIAKITAATGWRPEIPIERTVEDVYRWYVESE